MILKSERVALNFLDLISGVATITKNLSTKSKVKTVKSAVLEKQCQI